MRSRSRQSVNRGPRAGGREDGGETSRSWAWGSGIGRDQMKQDAVYGQRAEWLRREEDSNDAARVGGGGFRTRRARDPRRENKGGAGATRSRGVEGAERVGGPTQPSRSCGRRRGRERRGGGTYWGPSSRCSWGSPPADEGRGSPGRPGGPGRCRTGQWSRPWLRGTLFGHSPYLTTPCPQPPRRRYSRHRGA